MIDSTNLSDKGRMICKCNLTINFSNAAIRSVFGRAERLRNQCAHPGLDSHALPCSFEELVELVKDTLDITRALQESVTTETRARKLTGPGTAVEKIRVYGRDETREGGRVVVIATGRKVPDKPPSGQFFILFGDKTGAVKLVQRGPFADLVPADTCLTSEQDTERACENAARSANDVIWDLHAQGGDKIGGRGFRDRDELDRSLKPIEMRSALRDLWLKSGGADAFRTVFRATECRQLRKMLASAKLPPVRS